MNSLLREYAVAIVSLVCAVTFFWLYDLITSDSYVIGSGSIVNVGVDEYDEYANPENHSMGVGAIFSSEEGFEGFVRGSQNTDGGVWGSNGGEYVPHVKIDTEKYHVNEAEDCFLLDKMSVRYETDAAGNTTVIWYDEQDTDPSDGYSANVNSVSSHFKKPDDESYPFYWLNLNEILQGVTVSYNGADHNVSYSGGKIVVDGISDAEFVVNVEMLKPKIDSAGNIRMTEVVAKDSFGNILYDGTGKKVKKSAIWYDEDDSKYFIGGYLTAEKTLSDSDISNLYKEESDTEVAGTAGYNKVCAYSDGSCFIYNNNIPMKFRVTMRCTVGKHKSEITVFFINRVDSLLLDPTSYDAAYEQIFGHGGD